MARMSSAKFLGEHSSIHERHRVNGFFLGRVHASPVATVIDSIRCMSTPKQDGQLLLAWLVPCLKDPPSLPWPVVICPWREPFRALPRHLLVQILLPLVGQHLALLLRGACTQRAREGGRVRRSCTGDDEADEWSEYPICHLTAPRGFPWVGRM